MLTRMKKVRGNRPRGLPKGVLFFLLPHRFLPCLKEIFVETGFSFMVKPVPVSLHEWITLNCISMVAVVGVNRHTAAEDFMRAKFIGLHISALLSRK